MFGNKKWLKQGKAYVCDPTRNRKCLKSACWEISKGPCKCTNKKKFAKRDEHGEPVIATDDDLVNFEYLDQLVADAMKEAKV